MSAAVSIVDPDALATSAIACTVFGMPAGATSFTAPAISVMLKAVSRAVSFIDSLM